MEARNHTIPPRLTAELIARDIATRVRHHHKLPHQWTNEFYLQPMKENSEYWMPFIADCQSYRHAITSTRVYRAIEQLREFVDIDTTRRGGIPVLRGTRFKVAQLFAQLADGDSIDDLVENMDLDKVQLEGLLQALSVSIDRPPSK